jgi:hypothetical protein
MRQIAVVLLLLSTVLCHSEDDQKPAANTLEPVPSAEKLKAAEAEIRQIFKDELKKTAPQDQLALAANFIKQAEGTTDDTAARYKLLDLAIGLSIRSGDIDGAMQGIKQLVEKYQVDAPKLKAAALTELARTAKTKEQFLLLARTYVSTAEDALALDDYSNALSAYSAAQTHAHSGQDIPLFTTIAKKIADVTVRKAAFEKILAAKNKLNEKPDDPEANLTVGKFQCLVKGDWGTGLPLLMKSGDAKWASASASDLANPVDAPGQAAAGDKWYELGAELSQHDQSAVRGRAYVWYNKALPSVTGLTHAKIEKRLQEIQPEPSTLVTKQPDSMDPDSGLVSDATKRALPTREDIAELERLCKEARNSGDEKQLASASECARKIADHLSDIPNDMQAADWKARDEAFDQMNEVFRKLLPRVSYYSSERLWSKFMGWVSSAKGNEDFLQRLKIGVGYRSKVARFSNETDKFRQCVYRYVEANRTAFSSVTTKIQFCDWLKLNGISDSGIEDYRKELEGEIPRTTMGSNPKPPQPQDLGSTLQRHAWKKQGVADTLTFKANGTFVNSSSALWAGKWEITNGKIWVTWPDGVCLAVMAGDQLTIYKGKTTQDAINSVWIRIGTP